jgi:glycosyltransferase involved in cell wall biosynthesis
MKIGIMLRHLDQYEGGVLVYTRNLLDELLAIESGHSYVLIYRTDEFLGSYARHPRVTEVVLRTPTKLLWDQLGVPWLAARHGLDVVFNPKFSVPLFPGRAGTVAVVHGSEWFVYPELYHWFDRLYFQNLIPLYYRRARMLVAISEMVKDEVVEHVGIGPQKIVTVHHGVDGRFRPVTNESVLRRVREKYELAEHYLLWVGYIYPGKNVDRLYEAFAVIRNRIPHRLVMVGGQRWSPEKRGATQRQLAELGIADRVIFTGPVGHDELPALYSLADLFVFPSLYEGFGIPLIEAMACGCPVLSSNTCAVPEVVGDAGVLVDPKSVADIAEGMAKAVLDRGYRALLVERAQARARRFSWRKCARETLSALESTGGSGGGTHGVGRLDAGGGSSG